MGRSDRPPSALRGVLLFLLGALVGANATYFLMTRTPAVGVKPQHAPVSPAARDAVGQPAAASPEPALPTPAATGRGDAQFGQASTAAGSALLVPVQGIAAAQLSDTFTDSRSAGRLHDAIDIMAPAGTPVLAVADGHVEKLFDSKLGGLTLYHFNSDGTLAFYYAHLQRYADGMAEHQPIKRGQLIGYVGSTGNASPEGPHLHFAIFKLGPEKLWWKGEAINPYPLLAGTPR